MSYFNPRAVSKLTFQIFHVHTPSRKIKKKRVGHTNKQKTEKQKQKIEAAAS